MGTLTPISLLGTLSTIPSPAVIMPPASAAPKRRLGETLVNPNEIQYRLLDKTPRGKRIFRLYKQAVKTIMDTASPFLPNGLQLTINKPTLSPGDAGTDPRDKIAGQQLLALNFTVEEKTDKVGNFYMTGRISTTEATLDVPGVKGLGDFTIPVGNSGNLDNGALTRFAQLLATQLATVVVPTLKGGARPRGRLAELRAI